MTFKEDRLENEKNDPHEGSSLRFINVPIFLIALLLGFGSTYIALRTKNTSMSPGDSRTTTAETTLATTSATTAGSDPLAIMEKGKQVFTTTCQACHQASGAGIPGAFPPLVESEWVNGPASQVVAIVLHGLQNEITVKGQKFQGVMPPFIDQLKSDDVAAVVTYVRGSFGNKSPLVTVELVEKVKTDTQSKVTPWEGEKELNAHKWD